MKSCTREGVETTNVAVNVTATRTEVNEQQPASGTTGDENQESSCDYPVIGDKEGTEDGADKETNVGAKDESAPSQQSFSGLAGDLHDMEPHFFLNKVRKLAFKCAF